MGGPKLSCWFCHMVVIGLLLQEAGPGDVEGRQNIHVRFADAPNPCRVRPCNDSGTRGPGLISRYEHSFLADEVDTSC